MSQIKSTVDFREIARIEAGDSISLLPVIEKELLHYDIIRAMSENGFLEKLCFQGGTSLRLCYGSERFSEDLDFTGGVNFEASTMVQLKQCIEDCLSEKYGLSVVVKSPKERRYTGINVSSWQVKVITGPNRPDLPSQKIKIEVANVPSHTRDFVQISQNYKFGVGAPLIIGAQSMQEIMADKLLALPASVSNIRYRDIWDLNWMSMNKVKPNSELVNKKIFDYGTVGFSKLLSDRIDSLPGIINGPEFLGQMSRFLKRETIESSIAKVSFRAALVGNITRLMSALEEEVEKSPNVERVGSFSGVILDISNGIVSQRVNRDGGTVQHDLSVLSVPVVKGSVVNIKYVGGVGVVSGRGVSVGVGR